MRRSLAIVILCITTISAIAQRPAIYNKDSIVTEAKKLYNARVISACANKWLQNQGSDWENKVGGSFSYAENSGQKCVIFSDGESPVVLATLYFSDQPAIERIIIDTVSRIFTAFEQDVFNIKKQAQQQIVADRLFRKEENTNWSIIPLVDFNSKRVYVFAGSSVNGTIVFGNDYLLLYDQENHLLSASQLHQNIIPLNYRLDNDDEPITTVHNHSGCAASFLTATDICTVMLYEKSARWKKHMVISKTHVSVWDCEKDELFMFTVRDWEKQNR